VKGLKTKEKLVKKRKKNTYDWQVYHVTSFLGA